MSVPFPLQASVNIITITSSDLIILYYFGIEPIYKSWFCSYKKTNDLPEIHTIRAQVGSSNASILFSIFPGSAVFLAGMGWLFKASKLSIILSKQLTQKLFNSVKVRGLIGFICNVFEKLIKTLHSAEGTGDPIFSFSLHDCSEQKWIDKDKVNVKLHRQEANPL